MPSFLFKKSQCNELIRLWKIQLQVEEALHKTLTPVLPEIAQIEGRPYFKLPLPNKRHKKLIPFLLREQADFPLKIEKEQIPFLIYLLQRDRLKRKYHQETEHEFLIGFPAFFYKNKYGQDKLSTLFKFPLLSLEYPENYDFAENHSQLSFWENTENLILHQEKETDDEVGFAYWIDEFFLQEELEIGDEEILKFRRNAAEKGDSPSEFLMRFCKEVLRAVVNDRVDLNEVFETIIQSAYGHVQSLDNSKKGRQSLQVYPYLLVYELEDHQPTRQLQFDLDNIIDWEIFEALPEKHPAIHYLFGGNNDCSYAKTISGQFQKTELTDSQLNAVRAAKQRKLTVINGPPGTGKTQVIRNIAADRLVEYVLSIKTTDFAPYDLNHLTLVTSTNNRAVDNALEGMELEGILPACVRMGSRIVMSGTTVDFLKRYYKQLSKKTGHNSLKDFFKLKKKLKNKYIQGAGGGVNQSSDCFENYILARKTLDAWIGINKDKVLKLIRGIIADIEEKRGLRNLKNKKKFNMFLSVFPMIGSTLLSIRNLFPMDEDRIGLVIIDEAGQCLPSYCLPALIRAKQAVMIGDILQLEPIVKLRIDDIEALKRKRRIKIGNDIVRYFSSSTENPKSSHHISLEGSESIQELKEHFRCQSQIIKISMSLCGYQLNVKTEKKTLNAGEAYLEYINVTGTEKRMGGSWANPIEVSEVIKVVRKLRSQGVEFGEMVILTPFRGQLTLINHALKKERLPQTSGDRDRDNPNVIMTGTVHRFQGGERRVVIFSHVITLGEPTFLNSRVNLLNVAVSRAQEQFIFVGSLEALTKGTYTEILRQHLIADGQPLIV